MNQLDACYRFFHLHPGVSDDELKKAYHTLARKYHPDRNPNSPQANEQMKLINEKYDYILSCRKDGTDFSKPPNPWPNGYGTYTSWRQATEPSAQEYREVADPVDSDSMVNGHLFFSGLFAVFNCVIFAQTDPVMRFAAGIAWVLLTAAYIELTRYFMKKNDSKKRTIRIHFAQTILATLLLTLATMFAAKTFFDVASAWNNSEIYKYWIVAAGYSIRVFL